MKEKDFANLVESIKEAGLIKAGKLLPSLRFDPGPLDIKAIREKPKKFQSEFVLMIGVGISTLQKWE